LSQQSSRPIGWLLLALCCSLAVGWSEGIAQPATQYEPKEYQEGKDVVWVPTADTLVETMLNMAKVTAEDTVIDLGSGDGRTVIAAAKRGAKARGIEYNPKMVELSKQNAAKAGVAEKVSFVKADLFKTDFSQATVLTMFLLPEINLRLRPKILSMKPGTRVVSNSFDMGDWKADEVTERVDKCANYCNAFLWIVPAKVAGTWQTPQGRLVLKQTFQFVSGTLGKGKVVALVKGRVNGTELAFTAGEVQYRGKVSGRVIEGTAKSGDKEEPWKATRR
jgi:SAM-dependent methyltransferase